MRKHNSVEECLLYTEKAGGSNPSASTMPHKALVELPSLICLAARFDSGVAHQ